MLFDDDNNEEENSSINYNNNVNEENKNFNLDEDEESKDNIGEINNIGLFKKFPENAGGSRVFVPAGKRHGGSDPRFLVPESGFPPCVPAANVL